jgi:hypothetical protein
MSAPLNFRDFDGLRSRTIFCVWTGNEAMSGNRLNALWSIFSNAGCPIAYLNPNTIGAWEKPGFPFHPAYQYLSSTQKSDYLRCYLSHHYGGGYTDIKLTAKNWAPFFDQLEASNAYALGYPELQNGIPHMEGEIGDRMRQIHSELIGICSFICRKGSPFTTRWIENAHRMLDAKLPLFEQHPAQHPMDHNGVILPNGAVSQYPLRWAGMGGELFTPLVHEFRDQIIKAPIEPIFGGYR